MGAFWSVTSGGGYPERRLTNEVQRRAKRVRCNAGLGGAIPRLVECVTDDPLMEQFPRQFSPSKLKHDPLLLVHRCLESEPIEGKEDLHGGVPRALVSVLEWVIADQRETQRRSFFRSARVQVLAAEGGLGLGNGRLECSEVADSARRWRLRRDHRMEVEHLRDGQVPHLR